MPATLWGGWLTLRTEKTRNRTQLKRTEKAARRAAINLTRVEIMTRKEELISGYITETRAGDFVQRVATNKKPCGGCSVEWLYDVYFEESDTGEVIEKCERTGEYIVKSTGEVLQTKEKALKRLDNFRQIRLACERFKWKLRANAANARLFITLTYADNMTDTKRLYEDFRRFWQKFKRLSGCENAGYMVAFEPQERGAWHAHLITIGGVHYVPNDKIQALWGHGYSKTMNCQNVADLGGYLTSYLVNLAPCAEDFEEQKASKKNARLPFYPARFRFLRWSKGLLEPQVERKEFKEDVELETEDLKKIKDITKKVVLPDIITPIFTRYVLYVKKSALKRMHKRLNKSKRKTYKKKQKKT